LDALELLAGPESPNGLAGREPELPDGTQCTVGRTIFGEHLVRYHTEEIVVPCYAPDGQLIHLPTLQMHLASIPPPSRGISIHLMG
jgi:hypothetical protein